MSKHLVFLFLSGFVLAQIAQALPTPKNTDGSSSSESDESKEGHTDTLSKLIEEYNALLKPALIRAKTIADNVLKDETISSVTSENILSHKNKFSEFLNLANIIQSQEVKDNVAAKMLKNTATYWLLTELNTIINEYDTTKLKNPTTEDYIIETSLKKNDLTEFVNDVNKLNAKVPKDIETHQAAVYEELKEKSSEYKALVKEFHSEEDDSKKFETISKLLKLYA